MNGKKGKALEGEEMENLLDLMRRKSNEDEESLKGEHDKGEKRPWWGKR